MTRQRKTKVQLVGGLGNQLLGYAFGRYLEVVKGHSVVFDTSEIDRGYTKHGVTIETYSLPGEFDNVRLRRGLIRYWSRQVSFAIQSRLPSVKFPHFASRCYTATEVGWDPLHEEVERGTTVRGYFASSRYYDKLNQLGLGFSIEPKNPSKFFLETAQTLSVRSFISLHVRRGDYVALQGGYGLVGSGYFSEALDLLNRNGGDKELLVIFSDEIDSARRVLFGIGDDKEKVFICPPSESDAAESLALMTMAKHHIISNSTFSLWGALLKQGQGMIVVPDPWHKGMPTPNMLIPDRFNKINSHFE